MPHPAIRRLFVAAAAVSSMLLIHRESLAGELVVHATEKTELKAVFGRVESHDIVAARARLGGTIVELQAEAGTAVKSGDQIAVVVDDKLALQLNATDARSKALDAELANAVSELKRSQRLLATGVVPKSRVDTLQTQVDVLTNQVSAAQAERTVLVQQEKEGLVLAPAPGRVLSVPVTKGSVIMPGETVARIAGGGYFLRLSLPERHAAGLRTGDSVRVGARGIGSDVPQGTSTREGKLVKIYPEIENGRVQADVEVDGLGDFFVGERTLVWIPVAKRQVIAVPVAAVSNRYGVDYVRLAGQEGPLDAAVITGETFDSESGPQVEVISGLAEGDKVLLP